jgi:hypothetical protein
MNNSSQNLPIHKPNIIIKNKFYNNNYSNYNNLKIIPFISSNNKNFTLNKISFPKRTSYQL